MEWFKCKLFSLVRSADHLLLWIRGGPFSVMAFLKFFYWFAFSGESPSSIRIRFPPYTYKIFNFCLANFHTVFIFHCKIDYS